MAHNPGKLNEVISLLKAFRAVGSVDILSNHWV